MIAHWFIVALKLIVAVLSFDFIVIGLWILFRDIYSFRNREDIEMARHVNRTYVHEEGE